MTIEIIEPGNPEYEERIESVRERLRGGGLVSAGEKGGLDVPSIVREIIADVQARGDQAVIDLTRKIEGVELQSYDLHVSDEDMEAAHQQADPEFMELVRRVIANIREYQEHILVEPPEPLQRDGRLLGVRYTPLDRVGVYVPGGQAVYPSTVLMTIVPALVAGVGEIAIVSPPTTDGDVNPMVLAIAAELGIHEVYRVSGTAGVAALGIGTQSIPQVDKIVGPGNAFIAEAKRQLLGRVGIDSVAGPSEVLIIADDSARPDWVATDMIAQAEHDPGSAVLVTTSMELARKVAAEIDVKLQQLSRGPAAAKAIEDYGAIIVVTHFEQACDVANHFATEHLQIMTAYNDRVLAGIRHAGAIFVGDCTPVPLGDYYAGPSHVLPTGGTARFFSALSCNDFRKASSVLQYDRRSLEHDSDDVIDFATREGLTAHAEAVRIRTENA